MKHRFNVVAATALVLWIVPLQGQADIVQATYHITSSDFRNSADLNPTPPTSNFVEGTYTFTFDTSQAQQFEIVPEAVVGLNITDNDGDVFDYDETNSGINTEVFISKGVARLTIGGTQSSVAFMVGLSNDFRVAFEVSLSDYNVDAILVDLQFVTTVDAFYEANTTTVELTGLFVIPDTDLDGLFDTVDNCVLESNADQRDTDNDDIGNRCDPDFDQNCAVNFADLAVMQGNFFAVGDLDTDLDGDGNTNFGDLLILKSYFFGAPGPGLPGVCP